ncbi:MAG TPA: ATP-binding protein [Gammaproteobacteria bacterium]|nr:ATP-binding protein [Gammaproteobacteria bacterium]
MPAATRTELYTRLVELCQEFRAHGDLECEVALDEHHTKFDEELSEVVFRTVRELLTNVRQHAKATRVLVSSIGRRDGSIGILVADDGVGLPAHRRRGNPFDESGGIGLWSIDQRLRAFDAVLDVEAADGKGTRAMVILPGKLLVAD